MKIMIETQVMENYGDAENPYWKMKGGNDYVIENVKVTDRKTLRDMVRRAESQIESDDEYFRECIIGWPLEADDSLTTFEQDQLEYDGEIKYPAKRITV